MILLVLILLHAADGQVIEINPDQITNMRGPRDVASKDKLFPAHTRCLISQTDGKYVAVTEDCDTVKKTIEGK